MLREALHRQRAKRYAGAFKVNELCCVLRSCVISHR